jgi:hypothetical protein
VLISLFGQCKHVRVLSSTWIFIALFGTVGVCWVAPAQVITYEGNVFPEEVGWDRLRAETGRKLQNGWFFQTLDLPSQDFYRYSIGGISSLVGRFFFEWRAVTDNPEWLIDEWQVPAVVVAGGKAGVYYHVVMTDSAAALLRDVSIPRVIVPISVGSPHIYRVEVLPDEYIWYIDGVVVENGVPEGPYPDLNARVTWGAEVTYNGAPPATTAWDYVRAGRIPDDASGDYDSDGSVTLFDLYFLNDCLTKDGPPVPAVDSRISIPTPTWTSSTSPNSRITSGRVCELADRYDERSRQKLERNGRRKRDRSRGPLHPRPLLRQQVRLLRFLFGGHQGSRLRPSR